MPNRCMPVQKWNPAPKPFGNVVVFTAAGAGCASCLADPAWSQEAGQPTPLPDRQPGRLLRR